MKQVIYSKLELTFNKRGRTRLNRHTYNTCQPKLVLSMWIDVHKVCVLRALIDPLIDMLKMSDQINEVLD